MINAREFFTEKDNGLVLTWHGDVICNPPGGLVRDFWCKANIEIDNGVCRSIYWIGFSVEQLCLLASEPVTPLDWSLCVLRKRISFTRFDGKRGSPSHGNYVCLLTRDSELREAFDEVMAPHGALN